MKDYSTSYTTIIVKVPIRLTTRRGEEDAVAKSMKYRAQDHLARTGETVLNPEWAEAPRE